MKLEEYLEKEVYGNDDGFNVTDDETADWALEKIKEKRAEMKRDAEIAEKKIFYIEQWQAKQEEKLQGDIDYFQSLLAEYAAKKREENPKFKSTKLPSGTIRFHKQQPQYIYDDEKLLKYLKESGETDLINVKETPNKAVVRKLFNRQGDKLLNVGTGEIIDGVTINEREDKFEVIVDE